MFAIISTFFVCCLCLAPISWALGQLFRLITHVGYSAGRTVENLSGKREGTWFFKKTNAQEVQARCERAGEHAGMLWFCVTMLIAILRIFTGGRRDQGGYS